MALCHPHKHSHRIKTGRQQTLPSISSPVAMIGGGRCQRRPRPLRMKRDTAFIPLNYIFTPCLQRPFSPSTLSFHHQIHFIYSWNPIPFDWQKHK
ncbi:MAG: hypothetical protein IKX24_02930 [Prevotella sp.]|nr:hypothetical protein [Prevotella sp.]